MQVGVLALQGAFREHQLALEKCGAGARQVRKPEDLKGIEALVVPGGESTTMGKLMCDFGLLEPVRNLALEGLPVLGTCAGLIMLAKHIRGSQQASLGLMDMEVERNAFGRQVDSFEALLPIPVLGTVPLRAVFIRAPYIARAGGGVDILAAYGDKTVCARQGRFLAAAFHPELTDDLRLHRYFLEQVVG